MLFLIFWIARPSWYGFESLSCLMQCLEREHRDVLCIEHTNGCTHLKGIYCSYALLSDAHPISHRRVGCAKVIERLGQRNPGASDVSAGCCWKCHQEIGAFFWGFQWDSLYEMHRFMRMAVHEFSLVDLKSRLRDKSGTPQPKATQWHHFFTDATWLVDERRLQTWFRKLNPHKSRSKELQSTILKQEPSCFCQTILRRRCHTSPFLRRVFGIGRTNGSLIFGPLAGWFFLRTLDARCGHGLQLCCPMGGERLVQAWDVLVSWHIPWELQWGKFCTATPQNGCFKMVLFGETVIDHRFIFFLPSFFFR